jgi:hypothetical protein
MNLNTEEFKTLRLRLPLPKRLRAGRLRVTVTLFTQISKTLQD